MDNNDDDKLDDANIKPISIQSVNIFAKKSKYKNGIVEDVIKNMTCFDIFTYPVMALLFLILTLAAAHFYLFYRYTSGSVASFAFGYSDRAYVWVFLLFSIVFTLLFIWLIVRWKYLTSDWLARHYAIKEKERTPRAKTFIQKYNEVCGLNGSHYLYRL